jgi:hypothetical protein
MLDVFGEKGSAPADAVLHTWTTWCGAAVVVAYCGQAYTNHALNHHLPLLLLLLHWGLHSCHAV